LTFRRLQKYYNILKQPNSPFLPFSGVYSLFLDKPLLFIDERHFSISSFIII